MYRKRNISIEMEYMGYHLNVQVPYVNKLCMTSEDLDPENFHQLYELKSKTFKTSSQGSLLY